jgi:cell division protein FtsB
VFFLSRKKTVKPRFWLLMIAVMAIVFSGVYISQGQYLSSQAESVQTLEQQKAQALDENAALQRKIDFAKTDEYIERVAREQLGLLKKNEVRYVTGGN